MIPIAVISVILAIAVIPPVLAPDSDPIQFLQNIIPSVQIACAGSIFDCTLIAGGTDVDGQLIPDLCTGERCSEAGGTCHPVFNSLTQENGCECLFPGVGGWFLQVDKPALLLAGSQMTASWLIPIIVSAIGIGMVIARKF